MHSFLALGLACTFGSLSPVTKEGEWDCSARLSLKEDFIS